MSLSVTNLGWPVQPRPVSEEISVVEGEPVRVAPRARDDRRDPSQRLRASGAAAAAPASLVEGGPARRAAGVCGRLGETADGRRMPRKRYAPHDLQSRGLRAPGQRAPGGRAAVDIPRRLGWVWRTPPEALPEGLQAMFVRAANAALTSGDGVDFAANYGAWKEFLGARVLPWTWLGPPASTDGLAAAEVVVEAAPGEPLYVVCIEQGLPDSEAEAFAERLRQLAPGALVGFSSYPTRAQAASFGVPWDACVDVFDLGLPQVYFAGQRAELERVVADHRGRPLHVVVSPGDDAGWLATARTGLERHRGVAGHRGCLAGAGRGGAGFLHQGRQGGRPGRGRGSGRTSGREAVEIRGAARG